MPLLQYVCRACGEKFEELVPFGKGSPSCPACQSAKVDQRYEGPCAGGGHGKGGGCAGNCASCAGCGHS